MLSRIDLRYSSNQKNLRVFSPAKGQYTLT